VKGARSAQEHGGLGGDWQYYRHGVVLIFEILAQLVKNSLLCQEIYSTTYKFDSHALSLTVYNFSKLL
jgi:hypothetical protein